MKITIELENKASIEKEEKEEIKVILQYNTDKINDFISYIKEYEVLMNKVIVSDENMLVDINCNDIIMFYSDKKNNYCKTKEKEYKVKNKLYEIEKNNMNYIRISKSCIINIKKVEAFDLSESNKIIVKMVDGTEEYIARRRIKDIMSYLDERRI